MQVHLVDATYELFRAHFSPRPPVLGRDGIVLSGVSGLVEQLLFLLREQGATHVGCATDRVIRSFRNDLYPAAVSLDPRLADWRADLMRCWGTDVAMTGSGSALFGFFASLTEASDAAAAVDLPTRLATAATPVPRGWEPIDG